MKAIPQAGVSIVICCFNSATRLRQTLHHIASQNVPERIPWEVILVDNASTDDTAAVAKRVWRKTGCSTPFEVVVQPTPGLAAAREKGIAQSRYDFILFCDDDNWLQKDYVHRAYATMLQHPEVAALGGQGVAVSDGPFPKWFERYAVYYAIGPQAGQTGDVTDTKGYVYGAGMVLRRSAWEKLQQIGFKSLLTGRKGDTLTSSEDREICCALRILGYKVRYDDELFFKHHITEGRLEWRYFLRLVQTAHRTTPHIVAYHAVLNGKMPGNIMDWYWLRRCVAILKRALKRPNLFIAAALHREGNHAAFIWRQMLGEWQGWWAVQKGYAQVFETVQNLQRRVINGPETPL